MISITCFSMARDLDRIWVFESIVSLFRTGLFSDLFDDTQPKYTRSFPKMASFSNWMWIWLSATDFLLQDILI